MELTSSSRSRQTGQIRFGWLPSDLQFFNDSRKRPAWTQNLPLSSQKVELYLNLNQSPSQPVRAFRTSAGSWLLTGFSPVPNLEFWGESWPIQTSSAELLSPPRGRLLLLWRGFCLDGGEGSGSELRAEQSLFLQQSLHLLHNKKKDGWSERWGTAERTWTLSHIYPLQAVIAEMECFFQLLLQLCSLPVYSFSELLHLWERLPAPSHGVSLHSCNSHLEFQQKSQLNDEFCSDFISNKFVTCTRLMSEAF